MSVKIATIIRNLQADELFLPFSYNNHAGMQIVSPGR